MRDFVYGDDVVLLAWKENGYYPFACVEEVAISVKTELLPASTSDTGAWDTFKPSGRNSWDGQLNGVQVIEDAVETLWFGWEMLLQQVRMQGLLIKFRMRDRNNVEKYCAGFAYIPESNYTGRSNDFGRYGVRLQGSGALDLNGVLNEVNDRWMRIDWTATGAEAGVFQDNSLIGILLANIKLVSWEGNDVFKPIDAGAPTAKEVKHDNVAGTLTFLNAAEEDDQIFCIIETGG